MKKTSNPKKRGGKQATARSPKDLPRVQKGRRRRELTAAKNSLDLETEVERRTKTLRSEIAELTESSRSKDEFVRITVHELRTPLDVIRGNLDMVLKGETGKLPETIKEYLSDALAGADRLSQIVNDMLETSRIETGRIRVALEKIDAVKLLKDTAAEFRKAAEEQNLRLHLEVPPDTPPIFSDVIRVNQILDNLIGNALKFTPAGGSITITARGEEETVAISVKDTGVGIRPEDINRLFKRFPKIESGLNVSARGIGLGLSLVWQLVEKLGGEVWVESGGLGKGAMFSFRLPRHGTPRAEALARFHKIFLSSVQTGEASQAES